MKRNHIIENDGAIDWNMNIAFLQRLDRRLEEVDNSFNNGDLFGSFRCLDSVWSNIIFKIKEKGNEEGEKAVYDLLSKLETLFLNNAQKQSPLMVEQELRKLRRMINELLYVYGMIGQKKRENIPLEHKLLRDYEGDFSNAD